MSKKILALILVVLMVAVAFAGCAPKSATPDATSAEAVAKDATETSATSTDTSIPNPAKDRTNAADTLIVGMSEAKGEFLPAYYSTTYDAYIVQLMFDQLLTNDKTGALVPQLAKSYDLSEDKKVYTFHLRDDVKFWDGTGLTAKDVAFTLTTYADPSYDGRYNSSVFDIVGFEDYNAGDAKELAGVKVIDDYTVSVEFVEAKVGNIYNLTGGIMPVHYYGFEKGNAQALKDKMAAVDIMGSGRYKMVKFEPKQYVEFVANDNWFGGKINVKNLICKFTTVDTYFQELEAGSIDVQLAVPPKDDNKIQIEDIGFINTLVYSGNSYGYMGFNLRDERLADQRVRQALVYGFDRKSFVDLYYNGNAAVCNTPISQVSWAYSNDVNQYDYNMETAIALLEEAGWKVGPDGIREKDGKKLEFIWDTYTDSKYVETLIPLLQEDWKKIGVKVEPNLMDFNSLVEKVYVEQNFDLYNMAWSMTVDPGDNYYTFHTLMDEPDGNNSIGLRDPEIDKLLEDGLKEFDQSKRIEIYKEFAVKMNEKVPYMFLTQSDSWDVFNNRVKNFVVSSYCDWTYYIESVELE